ncbi:MAG: glycosyltransferase family 4 protein [candidate division KSB1 bacterium]|nr:glycosyltransferase family 4 protein [candidate division KSB1 bacterium]
MNTKKIKVVWLCHFTNKDVQDHIKPFKRIGEIAPWIPTSLKIWENDPRLELHVISPHEYIKGIKKYTKEGINYYFYNAHMPLIGRHWPGFLKWDYISNYKKNRRITKKLVNQINPDIIHLHGAENAYYSSTALQFINTYPTILTLQGFISKTSKINSTKVKKRIAVESEILRRIKNAFYRTNTMANDIKGFNPNINLFWNTYPKSEINYPQNISKKYDLVFFARIAKDKGIEDLLKALSMIKKKKPNISLCVIGSGNIEPFKRIAEELGVHNNVEWAGFLPTQNDVHKMASKAKISVLPTYHDIISGTILESMFLKIPVVAYNVGSIHEVNEKEEIISLVDKLDVKGLAKAIENLLDNPDLRKERAEKSYKRAHKMFAHSDDEIRKSLLKAYRSVINDFK